MTDHPIVAVIGASGGTGQAIVDQLLQAKYRVRAFSRQSPDLQNDKEVTSSHIFLDLTKTNAEALAQHFQGVKAVVFAAAGSPEQVDRDGAILCIEAALLAKVNRFILITGLGSGRKRPSYLMGGFWDTYFGAKEASEKALKESGLAYTILQPAELTNGAGTGLVRIGNTGELPIETIPRQDVAAVVIASVEDKRSIGQSWEIITGPQTISESINHLDISTI